MTDMVMSQLVTHVEQALYQSAGPTVQLYSQDIIMQMIQDAFEHLFTKQWWKRFRTRETLTLNGTNGLTTTPLTTITQFDDIKNIYNEFDQKPLPAMPLNSNVSMSLFSSGGVAKYVDPAPAPFLFRIIPPLATGNVMVVGRQRPTIFSITDTVPFDYVAVKHFAAWAYFTDDDSNPSAAAKHQGLFEARLKQLQLNDREGALDLDPNVSRYPNQWYEGPY